MDYASFIAAAERGQPPPLVLLAGGDAQLLDDALAAASRGLFRSPDEAALGREVFDGASVGVDEVVRAAMTLPFMTAMRLVTVRRCQALPARSADALAAYARQPNPSTCLLLLADEPLAATRDRGEHWLLGVIPAAAVIALPARRDRALEDWLRQRAALESLTLTEDAAHLLVQWVGDDAVALLGEARKAALAGGPDNRVVSAREVRAVVGEHRLGEVFELARAVGRRDVAHALHALDRLLGTEEPLRLLGLLAADVRAALTVADLRARGQSVEQVARAVRRSPAAVEAIARTGAALPRASLERRLARCWRAEWRLKSGGQPRAEMAALVAELCAER